MFFSKNYAKKYAKSIDFTYRLLYIIDMINIRNDHPIKADLTDELLRKCALIRELTYEVEQHLREATKTKVYLKREEVQKMLRLDGGNIPQAIPNFRAGRHWLYDEADVLDYVESHKRK